MKNRLELIRELQVSYSSLYGTTIVVTDTTGNPIASGKGENELCNLLLSQNPSLLEYIRETLAMNWNISKPLMYDILPGIIMAVAPVSVDGSVHYFVWAGVFVEEQTQELVKDYLVSSSIDADVDWAAIVWDAPEMTANNKKLWTSRINNLSGLMADCFHDTAIEKTSEHIYQWLPNALGSIGRTDQELLNVFLNSTEEFDFIGLAQTQGDEQFQITHITGNYADLILGASFATGEGLLGRVPLTDAPGQWENISRDPRAYFFHRFNLYPASLCSFPIKQDGKTTAVLFAGSSSSTAISTEAYFIGTTFASLVENHLTTQLLHQENGQQLHRLSSYMEICKMLATTPDLKRILYILVDISLNLVEGPFSCVILKQPGEDKVQLVSRGASLEQLQPYVKEAVGRHYDHSPFIGTSNRLSPSVQKTNWGESVIECPLIYGDQVLGILCVGTGNLPEHQLKEHTTFLTTFAVIGGISLQAVREDNQGNDVENQVDTLHRAVEQFDEAAFIHAEKAANMAEDFCEKLGLPSTEKNEIVTACKLHFYSPAFLKDMLFNNQAAGIIEDYLDLTGKYSSDSGHPSSRSSQILALLLTFIKQNENLDALTSLEPIEDDLQKTFISFVAVKLVVEQEFTLSNDHESEKSTMPPPGKLDESIKLSPREEEVLEQVLLGLNNREIAHELYISDHTVKNHVTKIFQKLHVSDRAHAISKVYQMRYKQYSGG
ncbi:LuxR C-terminal-related transcriptional regulator [Salipaludibacillus sp. CF4.18]|uniref:LuxR C-terminal-related transcriptional regulator n=1 Tax=Salipaludibacillus sp. CF4.18 TaxID=3373081 RepID=UPI003EE80106